MFGREGGGFSCSFGIFEKNIDQPFFFFMVGKQKQREKGEDQVERRILKRIDRKIGDYIELEKCDS